MGYLCGRQRTAECGTERARVAVSMAACSLGDDVELVPPQGAATVLVRIKLLNGKEHPLHMQKNANVTALETRVFDECLGTEGRGKRLRLILSGKVMEGPRSLASYPTLVEGAVIHAALSDVITGPIGDVEMDNASQTNRRGFDRLLGAASLNEDAVAVIRSTFYQEVIDYADTQPRREGEDERERMYRMEDEWIDRQSPQSEFFMNIATGMIQQRQLGGRVSAMMQRFGFRQSDGAGENDEREEELRPIPYRLPYNSDSDDDLESGQRQHPARNATQRRKNAEFIMGFSVGFLLGIIMLCFVWDNNMSKYQRAGIMAGVGCNVLFGLNPSRKDSAETTATVQSLESTLDTGGAGDANSPSTVIH